MALSPETEIAVEACYEAIAVPGKWTGALDDLAHSLGARACQIMPHEVADRWFGMVRSSGTSKQHELWERNKDWATDVYAPRGERYVREGHAAVIQSQLFSDEEMRCSRYHQEIALPAGCLHWACGIFIVEGRAWCMPFFRGTEPFAPEVTAPIAEIAGHIARIVSISGKVSRDARDGEILTLDRMGCAAMLIDRRGRVQRMNRSAEDLLCGEFGVRNGRLWTSASASQARLDRFVDQLEHAGEFSGLPAPAIIARDGAPWLLVEAMPVASASSDVFDGCHAILVVSDLTRPAITDAGLLKLVFGLTNAEARLAAAICEGNDLDTAATAFGVSGLTVRSQLKTIFAKTGSRRQAELVVRAAQVRNIARH
jgi:DNA-binding CsgD family transcriptional regulator